MGWKIGTSRSISNLTPYPAFEASCIVFLSLTRKNGESFTTASTTGSPSTVKYSLMTSSIPLVPSSSSLTEYEKTGITRKFLLSNSRIRASSISSVLFTHDILENRIPTVPSFVGLLSIAGLVDTAVLAGLAGLAGIVDLCQSRYSVMSGNCPGASGWYSPSHGTCAGGAAVRSSPTTSFPR
ncbi:MAG: hypothetical protein C5S40_01560 [ANME-2 cluster archaeon]|nr:hypothetical protein [ANME-2 cluster archaeon]